jgi:hypothetical protein
MDQRGELLDEVVARLAQLTTRVEAVLRRQDATAQQALAAELSRLRDDNEALRAALAEAEAAREADFALRTEAAEALDRAIAELRSMADAR